MKIALIVPVSPIERTGNFRTADQWKALLREIGHEVVVDKHWPTEETVDADLGIFLHGNKTHDSLRRFATRHPERRKIVALTGTDIYPRPDDSVLDSIRLADRLVILQEKAIQKVPDSERDRARVIFQSATPASTPVSPSKDHFDLCVIGPLRDVKDPLRTTEAVRLLPPESRVRIRQAGGVIDWKYLDLVETEDRDNPRYEWMGELDGEAVGRLLTSSHLMVISSFSEGGARVVGEAIVNGCPVLSSRIDGITGLIGDDYPGFFDAGDTEALAGLIRRAETDPEYLESLRGYLAAIADRFHRHHEREAWRDLIDELA